MAKDDKQNHEVAQLNMAEFHRRNILVVSEILRHEMAEPVLS